MAAYNKFYGTVGNWISGQMLIASTGTADTFKAALSNTAPLSSQSSWGGLSANEISGINGYTTGGATLTLTSSNTTGTETVYLTVGSPTWTGSSATSSAGFGPFRYVIFWDVTSSWNLAWFDYGSAVTVLSGNTFTLVPGSNLFTLA